MKILVLNEKFTLITAYSNCEEAPKSGLSQVNQRADGAEKSPWGYGCLRQIPYWNESKFQTHSMEQEPGMRLRTWPEHEF